MYTSTNGPLFARTKLRPPRVHADVLMRERLSSSVARGLDTARLILLSAPAGSGKTTLLASALAAASHDVAWLALDADDNDPARFLRVLVASLSQTLPDIAAHLAPVLAAGSVGQQDVLAWGRQVIVMLVNALPDDAALVIALDDLHVVTEPLVYTLLDELIERLPDGVALAFATRHDPPLALARLRARRQLHEVRLPDLRFRVDETATLLNERLQLQLAGGEIAALHAQTDGWVAGLHLLAGALDRITTPAERARFLQQLHGMDRAVFDYLAEEVLNRQDPFVRMFLLETAVLPELTPTRCEALTGRDDATLILDDLYRRNLFLVALDDEGRKTEDERVGGPAFVLRPSSFVGVTYRYHDLFRAFLLARLEREHPSWLTMLHRRAADTEPDMARRIAHLLQAQAWDAAVATIEQQAPALAGQGAWQMLRGCIAALPDAVRDVHPWLLYWLGMCEYQLFALGSAQTYFERALAGFVAGNDATGEAATLVRLIVTLHNLGDWPTSQALTARGLTLSLTPEQRAELIATRATQLLVTGSWQASLADVETLIDELEYADSAHLAPVALSVVSGAFSMLPGSMMRLARLIRLLERRAADDQARMALLEARAFYGLWGGHWSQALVAWEELCQLGAQIGTPDWPYIRIGSLPAHDATLRGDRSDAEAAYATVLTRVANNPASASLLTVFYHLARARMRWLFGDQDAVRADYETIIALEAQYGPHPFVVIAQPLMRGLLAWMEQRYAEAEAELRVVLAVQEQVRYTTVISDVRVPLGALLLQRNQADAALAAFLPALADAVAADAPGYLMCEGHIIAPLLRLAIARNIHADFAQRTWVLLDTFVESIPNSQSLTSQSPIAYRPSSNSQLPSGEALTEREIEVLHALATGASNAEIAEQLTISPHTAKRHVANVLAKLNATTRTEAAMRARDLGLLEA